MILKLPKSKEAYDFIREELIVRKLDTMPTYSGFGMEVYERPDRTGALIVDWDRYEMKWKELNAKTKP